MHILFFISSIEQFLPSRTRDITKYAHISTTGKRVYTVYFWCYKS